MRTISKNDANRNRTNAIVAAAVSAAQYDAQDRLLSYDSATYQYNEAGTLTNKTIGGQATTYRYDALGSLLSVSSATAAVGYSVDALGRRIAKRVNGVMTRGYVYKDFLNPVAEVDNDDNVVSVFIYGTRRHVPAYLVKNGVTYRIITDHLGSVRLLVSNVNGSIAQRIDYDEWGRVVLDTNPGFQPFGFAGGLYDPETGLVRFGFRDYDAETGRWLAKDPIGLSGGLNLYAFCHNDSVNWVDPWGLGEDSPWYERAWNWWTEWSSPKHGYWVLQGNIPLGGILGISVAGIYDTSGIHLGFGAYLGIGGVSLTRGVNQHVVPNSHNVSGQFGFLAAGEPGRTFGPGSLENIYGQPSNYFESGVGLGVSGNYLFITEPVLQVP